MDINILQVMKHRYPFLLVDKVIECEYLKSSKVLKNVSYNEPWVQGHYPEHPIMPGVLLIEMMGQASGFMMLDLNHKDAKQKYGYLTKVNEAKFIKPVYPGDQLIIDSKLIEHVGNYIQIEASVRNVDQLVSKCRLSYILKGENDEL